MAKGGAVGRKIIEFYGYLVFFAFGLAVGIYGLRRSEPPSSGTFQISSGPPPVDKIREAVREQIRIEKIIAKAKYGVGDMILTGRGVDCSGGWTFATIQSVTEDAYFPAYIVRDANSGEIFQIGENFVMGKLENNIKNKYLSSTIYVPAQTFRHCVR